MRSRPGSEISLGLFSARNLVRLLLGAALSVLLMAAMAAPAHASGIVTVNIVGVGHVSGQTTDSEDPAIDCTGTAGGSEVGDCTAEVVDQTECDPERKPPCHTVAGSVFLSATDVAGAGFTFGGWSNSCAAGQRNCSVRVLIGANNNRTVTATFNDVQPPTITLTNPAPGLLAGTMSLGATASDNAGVSEVQFTVRGTLVVTDTTAPFNATFNTATVSDGPATVNATARDAAGLTNTSSAAVTIDNTRPTLSITGPNGQPFPLDSTQSWSFTPGDATSGVASVLCSVVPAGQAPAFGTCSGGTGSHSVSGLREGNYTFTVRVRDRVGNTLDVTRGFSIDGTPPQTTITSGLDEGATSAEESLTWGFASNEPNSTFQCRIYPTALIPGAFGPCSSAVTHTVSGFVSGTYSFEVRAFDAAGNVDPTPAKRTFTSTKIDQDQDGYDTRVDCNDSDPTINPGAHEILDNSVDENCDGVAGVNLDRDRDGYNRPYDCNDANPTINPGAPEILDNSVDENCDGVASVNLDRDRDGYNRPYDCNDANPTIHPGARDLPGNRIDEDCVGGPAPFPTLTSRIAGGWVFAPFHFTRLYVKPVMGGSRIQVRCRGGGCTFRSRTITVRKNKRGISILGALSWARLQRSATVEIRITHKGYNGVVRRFTVRANGQEPRMEDLCLPAHGGAPKRC